MSRCNRYVRHLLLGGCALLSASWSALPAAAAGVGYSITPILSPDARISVLPTAINDLGQVTGYTVTGDAQARPFRWDAATGGHYLTPGPLHGGQAVAINNRGDIVISTVDQRAAVFRDGALQQYGTLGGVMSQAFAINAHGQMAGASTIAGSQQRHAVVFDGLSIRSIGTLPGDNAADGLAINDRGDVAGGSWNSGTPLSERAFLYRDGQMSDLQALLGEDAVFSYAVDINNRGDVLGNGSFAQAQNTFGSRAFLYSEGVMTRIDAGGGSVTEAHALNDLGQVVGSVRPASGQPSHPFLLAGGEIIDLRTRFSSNDLSGWTLTDAVDINDAGQILLTGHLGQPGGVYGGFLLTPIPEPGTVVLVAAGLGVLLSARKRRA